MYICTLLLFEFVDTITLMDMDIDYSFYVAYASWPLWLLARLPLFFFFPSRSCRAPFPRPLSAGGNDNFDYIDASFYEPQWY